MVDIFDFTKKKRTSRNTDGTIKSIKPLESTDSVHRFNVLVQEMQGIALKFPKIKFAAEMNGINESDFKEIEGTLNISPDFSHGNGKFFFNTTPNSVIICHREA